MAGVEGSRLVLHALCGSESVYGGPFAGELAKAEIPVGGVGPLPVVFDAPVIDNDSGFEQMVDQPAVEEFATETGLGRLDPADSLSCPDDAHRSSACGRTSLSTQLGRFAADFGQSVT